MGVRVSSIYFFCIQLYKRNNTNAQCRNASTHVCCNIRLSILDLYSQYLSVQYSSNKDNSKDTSKESRTYSYSDYQHGEYDTRDHKMGKCLK